MIHKLISSGRTGVELAALDVAIKLGLSHGGWTPRGRRNHNGPLGQTYSLKESSTVGFQKAMEQNVVDSHGTLLITRGQKTPETRFAVQTTLKQQNQLLHVDLSQNSGFECASLANAWFTMNAMKVVFVTGITDRDDPTIYGQTAKILETAFYLGFVKEDLQNRPVHLDLDLPPKPDDMYPKTVQEAVERLTSILPLKDLTILANMQIDELHQLPSGLGEYIKQNFGLYTGNKPLMQSIADEGGLVQPILDEACAVILRILWETLQRTHKLRCIK